MPGERMKHKPKSDRQKLILANDKLFREIIHLRDRVCQKTGRKENLQVAHFWRRNLLRTRWDLLNACLLSGGTHLYWAHSHFQEFMEWWKKRIGPEAYSALELKARYAAPVKTQDLLLTNFLLKKTLKEFGDDELKPGGR